MDNKTIMLKNVFKNKFEMNNFKIFAVEFFKEDNIKFSYGKKSEAIYKEYKQYINNFTEIGVYSDSKDNKITILAVELKIGKSVEKSRSMQRNYVAKFIENNNYDAAFVAFYSQEDIIWRLSFVRLDYSFSSQGILKNITPARRYSYLLGKDEPCHTAQQQLINFLTEEEKIFTIDEIEEAFKVEKVTKDFFNKYREKYHELKEYLDDNDEFINESNRCGFTSEEFAKKLMGQISFLYFLQKKGWLGVKTLPKQLNMEEFLKIYKNIIDENERKILIKVFKKQDKDILKLNSDALRNLNDKESDILALCFKGTKYNDVWGNGNKHFIRHLFNFCEYQNKSKKIKYNFFHDYLEPLFYNALNKKRGSNQYFKEFNCRIPFLNGGLFEALDNYAWDKHNFNIPNYIFSNKKNENDDGTGILDIFDIYNFTMNEDEPLEKEVAIDPEMLGKIFENLLDVKDRKSKGAFYTPREVVHYMCQESLINYIKNKTNINKNDIKTFIQLGEYLKDEDKSSIISKENCKYSIPESVLNNINIIDKALNDVKVCDPAVGSGAFPLGMLNEIVKARNNITEYLVQYKDSQEEFQIRNRRSMYELKKQVMENSIYAVDLEPSAVDITKLRLWLSIIVDNDIDTVNPLPNLDCHIMCGNSLIEEFEGIKLFDDEFLNNITDKEKKQLRKFEEKNNGIQIGMTFDEKGNGEIGLALEKKILIDIEELRKKFFNIKNKDEKERVRSRLEDKEWQLIEYKLSKDSNLKKLDELKMYVKQKRKPYFLWHFNFSDVFKENGGFDIVIGNPPYGAKLDSKTKKILHKKYVNVPDYESSNYFVYKAMDMLKTNGYMSYIIPNTILSNLYAGKMRKDLIDMWQIKFIDNLSEIDVFESAKVRTCIVSLKNSCNNNYKVKFSNPSINEGMYNVLNIKEIEKSFLSENIDNWLNIFYKDKNTINLINKIKENSIKLGDISEVSQGLIPYDKYRGHSEETIKNRIWHSNYKKDETFKKELKGKDIERYKLQWNGETWISYGEWLAAPRKKEFFIEKRILVREITNPRILATIVDEEYYNTPSIINIININNIEYKYILGLLNSKLMSYYHINTSPKANKGLFPKILVNDIRNLPIRLIYDDRMKELGKFVEMILDKEVDEIKSIEKSIDNIVYSIYELSNSEIQEIENYFN